MQKNSGGKVYSCCGLTFIAITQSSTSDSLATLQGSYLLEQGLVFGLAGRQQSRRQQPLCYQPEVVSTVPPQQAPLQQLNAPALR